jgi:F-type H+-transporting ATPase subunit epsilon
MQIEIITPEERLFAGIADAVQFPGLDGSFQVLNSHAPIISALTKGVIKVALSEDHKKFNELKGTIEHDPSNDKEVLIEINGGVMEMQNDKVIVLAE